MSKVFVKIFSLFCLLFFAVTFVSAQTVTLSFTGRDTKNHFIPMNYVCVENVTRSWQDTLVYPDTVLLLTTSGINDFVGAREFSLSQNMPNPFDGTTSFSLQMPQQGSVLIEVFDLAGRKITAYENTLQAGIHTFRVLLSMPQSYLLSVRSGRDVATLKMINNGNAGDNAIRYMGEGLVYPLKMQLKHGAKGASDREFALGDEMSYTGYVIQDGEKYVSQNIKKTQNESENFSFTFDIPEPATLPVVKTDSISNIGPYSAICGGEVLSDGGAPVTARGVCWNYLPNPTLADHFTVDSCGVGTFVSMIDSLTPVATYYVCAYATNAVGTAYGEQFRFTTLRIQDAKACAEAPTVTDYDGNVYSTVLIGKQCWMKENLRTTHYGDGTEIQEGTGPRSDAACWYMPNNNPDNVKEYGYLYNWSAVVKGSEGSAGNPSGLQGICPEGWHVPSESEWLQMTQYVGSKPQYQCGNDEYSIAKALASTTGFLPSEEPCAAGLNMMTNNATGFTAMPAGYQYLKTDGFSKGAYFWSATSKASNAAYGCDIQYCFSNVEGQFYGKDYCLSVRCLLNLGDIEIVVPSVKTAQISELTETTAVCGGNVTSDGGDSVVARGVCWTDDIYSFPTIEANHHTVDGAGTGEFVSRLEGLAEGTTYVVRAYATNSKGTAYGILVTFTTASSDGRSCPNTPTVKDVDGNTYNTLLIGEQCWMKENLRTTHFADGTDIAEGKTLSQTEPVYYHANGNAENDVAYGLLYNWPAAMKQNSASEDNPSRVQGICPEGWHVPSDAEWKQLISYLNDVDLYRCSGLSQYLAKATASTTGWKSSKVPCAIGNNQQDNNVTGFSVMPAGCYYAKPELFGEDASLWSTTERDSKNVLYCDWSYSGYGISSFYDDKSAGFSVRCLKDSE